MSKPRDDLLVSVALSGPARDAAQRQQLAQLGRELDTRFRYWEILLACDVADDASHGALQASVPNLRLLHLRPGASFYQRRLAVASEAIGDVVVVTAASELGYLDLATMIETAEARHALVVGRHVDANPLGSLAMALGRGAGLTIGPHDMLTIAFPRALLGIVLAHPDRLLATRFPPVDQRLPILRQDMRADVQGGADLPRFRSGSETGPLLLRRTEVLHRLTISSAPRVLTLVAAAALLAAFGGMLFAAYSVIVWLTLEHIQPGWFTTSLALSLTAAFLGFAIFGLSIGLRRLLEALTGGPEDLIIDEAAPIDLFGKVMDEFNVEIATHQDHAAPVRNAAE
ncbi:hypothetical protein HNO88_001460 [Novosphingobium chloroacetimidivorans]|uniref:Uncharacterized protein n=1 Tax=Novosphingobium chloroacetimidivorans TaxID=1428314 RepID=A0A7W7K8H0_9SPHN|nr:hypothetical protein [Novosphingobium chloroacetimidivorans]MBB4858146.1 hypothetical protein [Novosphingobium chloroacetimidivorans]